MYGVGSRVEGVGSGVEGGGFEGWFQPLVGRRAGPRHSRGCQMQGVGVHAFENGAGRLKTVQFENGAGLPSASHLRRVLQDLLRVSRLLV